MIPGGGGFAATTAAVSSGSQATPVTSGSTAPTQSGSTGSVGSTVLAQGNFRALSYNVAGLPQGANDLHRAVAQGELASRVLG